MDRAKALTGQLCEARVLVRPTGEAEPDRSGEVWVRVTASGDNGDAFWSPLSELTPVDPATWGTRPDGAGEGAGNGGNA